MLVQSTGRMAESEGETVAHVQNSDWAQVLLGGTVVCWVTVRNLYVNKD